MHPSLPLRLLSLVFAAFIAGWVGSGCGKSEKADVVDVQAQIKALESAKDADARINAMGELQKAGPAAAPAIPKVIPLLSDSDPIVQRMAAFVIESVGPAAKDAGPALDKAMQGAEPALMIAINRARTAIQAKPTK